MAGWMNWILKHVVHLQQNSSKLSWASNEWTLNLHCGVVSALRVSAGNTVLMSLLVLEPDCHVTPWKGPSRGDWVRNFSGKLNEPQIKTTGPAERKTDRPVLGFPYGWRHGCTSRNADHHRHAFRASVRHVQPLAHRPQLPKDVYECDPSQNLTFTWKTKGGVCGCGCVCACVNMGAHVYTWVWRPEVHINCPPP